MSAERQAYLIDEFCEAYRVSRRTVYRMIRAGRLRTIKAMNRTLIPVQSVEEWAVGTTDKSHGLADKFNQGIQVSKGSRVKKINLRRNLRDRVA